MGLGQRLSHSTASSLDFTCQSQKPALAHPLDPGVGRHGGHGTLPAPIPAAGLPDSRPLRWNPATDRGKRFPLVHRLALR